ncbi:glycosyltransferase family 2 protein [Shewanella frigidimarina]
MPMYNSQHTIVRALESIEVQSVLPEVVIIIDDGSKDQSISVVQAYKRDSSLNIKILTQNNSGPSSARNKGINAASEFLISFLDADDEWHPLKIEKQLEFFLKKSQTSQVGLVECYMTDVCGDIEIKRNTPTLSGHHFPDFISSNVIKGTPCVMVPKHILESYGGFDESLRFSEDRMLWSLIAADYEIFTVPEFLVIRHFGYEGNITNNPAKNYKYKKEFIKKFISQFSNSLSKKDIIEFKLSNMYDFMTVFYKKKDYHNCVECYTDMISTSYSTLYYKRFYPLIKFLVSYVMTVIKSEK